MNLLFWLVAGLVFVLSVILIWKVTKKIFRIFFIIVLILVIFAVLFKFLNLV